MCVFFRLGNAQLSHAHLTEIFAKAIADAHPGEGHLHMGHCGVIFRVAHEGDGKILTGKAIKIRVHQSPGDLPGPVGTEVEEYYTVVIRDGTLGVTDHGLHKLVRDAGGIGVLHSGHGHRVKMGALPIHHSVIGLLHPVPALVAVHGVVPAHHSGDLSHADLTALLHGLSHKLHAGGGGHIPSVQKGVDIDPLQAFVPGQLQKGEEMLDVGVDTAIGKKAHQVQGGSLFFAGIHGVLVGGIGEEVSVRNGFGDAGQILKHHPAGADVGVAHLTVAHLPLRKSHVQSGR